MDRAKVMLKCFIIFYSSPLSFKYQKLFFMANKETLFCLKHGWGIFLKS